MAAGFGKELISSIKPRLRAELIVEPTISLEIKLRLERLRLAELQCASDNEMDSCREREPALTL
jgi:hypothetical protein